MGRLSTPHDRKLGEALADMYRAEKRAGGEASSEKRRKEPGKVAKNRKRRERLRERDGWACWVCGRTPKFLTIDHMWPRSCGGCNCLGNLKLACGKCNGARANQISPRGHTSENCPKRR